MKLNKAIIFSLAIVQASSSFASGAGVSISEAGKNLGEVIKDAAKESSPAVSLLGTVSAGFKLCSTAQDIVDGAQVVHSYINPSKDQQAADIKTRLTLEYLKSERGYRTCMVDNAKSRARTSSGFPASCHSFEEAFVEIGGRKEVDGMKQSFKKYDTGELCSGKEDNGYSTTQKVAIGGAVGVVVVAGAVIAAPYVLPASTYAAIQTAVAAGATKASAAAASSSTMTKVKVVVEVAKLANTHVRPYVCPSEEQQVQQLSHQRSIQRTFSDEIKEALAKQK